MILADYFRSTRDLTWDYALLAELLFARGAELGYWPSTIQEQ